MKEQPLIATAKMLVADDKGLLAMDESTPTCNKRFDKLGFFETEELLCHLMHFGMHDHDKNGDKNHEH